MSASSSNRAADISEPIVLSFSEQFYAEKRVQMGNAFDEARVKELEVAKPEFVRACGQIGCVQYKFHRFIPKTAGGVVALSDIMRIKEGIRVWVLAGQWAMITTFMRVIEGAQEQGYGTAAVLAIIEWLLKNLKIKVMFVRGAGKSALTFWRWIGFKRQQTSELLELPLHNSGVPISWDIPMEGLLDDGEAPCESSEGGENLRERAEEDEGTSPLAAINRVTYSLSSKDMGHISVFYPPTPNVPCEANEMIVFQHFKVTKSHVPAKYWVFKADVAAKEKLVSKVYRLGH